MRAARELVERAAHGTSEHTYGVNTGFGRFVNRSIPEELTEELQLRLLRSHACGVGEPYPDEIVRAAMLLRANTLAKGNSGARVETVELLLECLNRGVLPVVPARGSVGASGDLAPLAHLALPLVGEGEAFVEGERLPGREALARVGLEPIALEAKEGLSLINGTQFMAAFARARARARAPAARSRRPRVRAVARGAAGLAHVVPARRSTRCGRCAGRATPPRTCSRLLDGSAIIESHRWCDKVQDAYSLRCAPQVHGASRDLLDYADYTVSVELNAATDNPLVLVEEDALVSNGNFHGQPLAFALDALAMAVAELASISERRVERLVNPNLSDGLPAFLTVGRRPQQRLHDPAVRRRVARLARTRCSAIPRRVDSIPTSAGQEDHVSMGNAGGPEGVAGARELRAGARDRAARRRAGRRVPRAARARARRARDARRRSASCRRGFGTTGRSRRTSKPSRRRSATARSSPRSRT